LVGLIFYFFIKNGEVVGSVDDIRIEIVMIQTSFIFFFLEKK